MAVVLCSVLLASACSLGPRGDWKEAMEGAAEIAEKAKGARVTLVTHLKIIETNIRIDPQPLFPVLAGRVDFTTGVSHLVAETTKGRPHVFYDDVVVYLRRSKASVGASKKDWAKYDFKQEPSVDLDTNDRRDAVGAPMISPSLAVDLLEGVLTGSIKRGRTEQTLGVRSTMYKARMSPDAAVRDVRDDVRREAILRLFDTLGVQQDVFPVEVWLDDEQRPYRIRFIVEQQKDRVNRFRTTFDYLFEGYGRQLRKIVLPSSSDVVTSRRFTDFVGEAVREDV